MKISRHRFAAAQLIAALLLAGGGGGNGDGAETPSPENPTPIDPGDAPTGAVVSGVTLAEGWEDLREVPAPVNINGGWTDSVMVSASGRSLYFAYTRYDFDQFYRSGGTVWTVTGPARSAQMTGNEFKIFRADLTATGWDVNYHPVMACAG
ncbi:MAG: hypothetical protein HY308_01525 [Gammaproteobacteria bacterium]|nr:hypothetical protein [Gammaproteobacteria bacterium]